MVESSPAHRQLTVEAAQHFHQAYDGLTQKADAGSRPNDPVLRVLQALRRDLDTHAGFAGARRQVDDAGGEIILRQPRHRFRLMLEHWLWIACVDAGQ